MSPKLASTSESCVICRLSSRCRVSLFVPSDFCGYLRCVLPAAFCTGGKPGFLFKANIDLIVEEARRRIEADAGDY